MEIATRSPWTNRYSRVYTRCSESSYTSVGVLITLEVWVLTLASGGGLNPRILAADIDCTGKLGRAPVESCGPYDPSPLTAPTGADLISSNPDRGSLRGGDLKGRSRKGMDLAAPKPPFSLLLRSAGPVRVCRRVAVRHRKVSIEHVL